MPALAASLIGAVRVHLYGVRDAPCGGPPESPEAREVAQRLVKQTQELADHADVLMRELESRSVRFAKPPYGSRRGPGTSRVCPNDPRRSARRTAVRNRSCRVCQKPPRRPPAASPRWPFASVSASRRDRRVRGHRPTVHDYGREDRQRSRQASRVRRHDDPDIRRAERVNVERAIGEEDKG